ncbi:Type cbb3 cytochrome oxidase biogenesis protein CcoS, involved in heme b insertion [hydrothermal vent metagenome]|uniref:Type cbb3 cytochrome oxidase biogenesis protein CcoS, involved in heme b insertion n=1 Tax=hydrothermal vent metagenome TaxID=652676 RepID=A0A3B0VWS2_9ZZZZ
MDVIYGLIPMMLVFGFLVVVVFIWMAKTGHFDDLDGAANRIFMDDEYPEDLNKKNEETKLDGSDEKLKGSSKEKNE